MRDIRLPKGAKRIPPEHADAMDIRDFDVSETQITSLQGSPKKVGGTFWCWGTSITSLDGAPRRVGNFDCSRTRITTLEGAPREVRGRFCCFRTRVSLDQIFVYLLKC
jgi:hypothetical protein